MKIVYLDEPTYLPEDWRRRFAELGDFEVFHDRPDSDTAAARLSCADAAVVEWTRLDAALLAEVTRLRYITLVTSSFDMVDLFAAKARGITVAHCPDYSCQAVAEHTFALLLAVSRRLLAADIAVRQGASHLYRPFLGRQLSGLTLGLLGTGRIATAVARIAVAFGMRVIGTNRTGTAAPGITLVSLKDLLRSSDVLSLHLPLTPATVQILTAERLATLRPTAVLVNTCRGTLIDQAALVGMLEYGRLAGAALDDLADDDADRLRGLNNVVLSPGIAWYTDSARTANLAEIHHNLASYLAGRPENVLTAPVG
ncbi:2-hydroxyacid dehydrogenase [Streptomyces sp. SID12501]|uniref:D-2-hydroxyacid dehydrogenase n=1 Tax=Streptomyces sp. SID12501 TaxID=2706042 RepID=A0A6B3BP98_9ACTN|nr:NAD(P)-dependent oxidoreductase [Streptomyces sp. SID12501]NEC86172.1 D-2-hydroxyacid dehydrogenase [Streptomyces sp. SID12501]